MQPLDMTTTTHKDVTEDLVNQWAKIAVSHARTEFINDPVGVVATVAGLKGPWGFGHTPEEALNELESVLVDWVTMKLEDGDNDIPDMEGVHLVVDSNES